MPLPHRTPDAPPVRARRMDATNLCLLFAAALATLPWIFGREPSGLNPPAPLRDLSKDTSFAVSDRVEPSAAHGAGGNASSISGERRGGAGGANVQLAVYAP